MKPLFLKFNINFICRQILLETSALWPIRHLPLDLNSIQIKLQLKCSLSLICKAFAGQSSSWICKHIPTDKLDQWHSDALLQDPQNIKVFKKSFFFNNFYFLGYNLFITAKG
jgi:hypothetical protein